jgi:NAD(P)-dependent dehydrogenase (short-subunit alcohol dehydrogenase family)
MPAELTFRDDCAVLTLNRPEALNALFFAILGEARALELLITGHCVDAAEAERIGLISRIVEGDPVAARLAFAKNLTGYSLPLLGFGRAAAQRALTLPLHEGLKVEADLATLAYCTDDPGEASPPLPRSVRQGSAMRDGVILVTGASRGIGAAIAQALSSQGWQIAGLSRTGATAAGEGYVCDVTDEAAIAATFGRVAAKSKIVGLVNNAGQHEETPSHAITTADFERLKRLNATAVVVACREAYPHLKAAGGGLIVNIGSFFDKLGVAENLAYCASKAAVSAITLCLAVEWARDGIRVLDVAPGYIETNLNKDFMTSEKVQRWLARRFPVGRAGQADEVGGFVASLYTTSIDFLTGETIYLDGAQGMNH